MAVLTHNEIKKAIKRGKIKIEPYDESQIGPASIDLTLGNEFRTFKSHQAPYHVKNDANFEDITEKRVLKKGESIVVNPGEMILGITVEKITLSDDLCGRLEGRSRFARFGLAIHITAGFMQPGISNRQVLEIANLGRAPLALYPGTKICQFIFEQCQGKAKYQGRFEKQDKM